MSLTSRLTDLTQRIAQDRNAIVGEIGHVYATLSWIMPVATRWEQEVYFIAGPRQTGSGDVPLGLYVPYDVSITGIRYQFVSPTTGGTTTAVLKSMAPDLTTTHHTSANMSIAAYGNSQTITDLSIDILGGHRLILDVTNVGSGSIGDGLCMAVWGNYR